MSTPSNARLLVIQPAVPRYRESFFGELGDRLAECGIELHIATGGYANHDRDDAFPADRAQRVRTRTSALAGSRLTWRRWRDAFPDPDLVIVEQAIKNLETYPLLARQHLGGPSVAMWGHGRSYSTPQGPPAAALKQFLTRRSQWFFAYTQAGADYVVAHGFPRTRVSVLNNTIDTDALKADLARVSEADVAAFQRRLRLTPGRTALFLGGVDKAKGIDFLLESAGHAAARLPGFVLLVGGAGDSLARVQAAEAGGAPIRTLGRLDGAEKALALRSCDVLAIPSSIGLVAVDSLVAGRPIVTRNNSAHGPEAEYLSSETSVWLPTNAAGAGYARALVDTMEYGERLAAFQSACFNEAPLHSLDHMVDAFVEGVLAWDDVRQADFSRG